MQGPRGSTSRPPRSQLQLQQIQMSLKIAKLIIWLPALVRHVQPAPWMPNCSQAQTKAGTHTLMVETCLQRKPKLSTLDWNWAFWLACYHCRKSQAVQSLRIKQ